MYDPVIEGASRMESAQRRRGASNTDSCNTCNWREEAFGKAVCMNRNVTHEISKEQFHVCVKRGNFWGKR